MRKLLVLALLGLVVAALAVAGVAQGYHGITGKASVRITQVIVNPTTGCVSLKLDLRGWKMYPGQIGDSTNQPDGGHYHIYVDGQYYTAGANAKRARACGLEPGHSYQVYVNLAYDNHTQIAASSQLVSVIVPG